MAAKGYWFVFNGVARGGYELDDIKAEMYETFGLGAREMDRLFSGSPVVIKKVKDAETAARLQVAVESLGGVCWYEPERGAPSSYRDRRLQSDRRGHLGDGAFDPDRRQGRGRRYEDPIL